MVDVSKAAKIWAVVAAIPLGKVASYGQIAALSGLPGYARYVGKVLKELPDDSRLPWHRVLRSDGKIAFPLGSEAFEKQRVRLLEEGIVVKNGKVSIRNYGW
ncbi:MGMT family protein [Corallincola platygyrae]|uniref:MGMT family protein n=1 Tax=Corallincola platygyrae TaxID=1193278 RepID=A0ABW4XJA3_9GAMM